jgi:hypothetical protein
MNWKALIKTIAAAAAGAGLQSVVAALPTAQGSKYAPAVTAAILAATAYGARSPWVQSVLTAAAQDKSEK